MFLKIESKSIAQLCALSYMIPPKGRIRTKKGHWKPSMIECENSLVIHVKVRFIFCFTANNKSIINNI